MTITYLKYGKPDVERAQDDAETKIVVSFHMYSVKHFA